MDSLIEKTVAEMREALILGCVAALLSSCGTEPSCQNEILGTSPNPKGTLVAVAFSRNCGATVGNNLQISIVRQGDLPEGKGNALILDNAPPYSEMAKPVWTNNDHLTLSKPKNARIFLNEESVLGVDITFLELR